MFWFDEPLSCVISFFVVLSVCVEETSVRSNLNSIEFALICWTIYQTFSVMPSHQALPLWITPLQANLVNVPWINRNPVFITLKAFDFLHQSIARVLSLSIFLRFMCGLSDDIEILYDRWYKWTEKGDEKPLLNDTTFYRNAYACLTWYDPKTELSFRISP